MYALIPPRLLTPNGRRIHPSMLRLLKKFFRSVPANLTLADLRNMTQNWVLSKQNDPVTGNPDAERYAAKPDARWSELNLEDFLDDFRALGFVNAMTGLHGVELFDLAVVPGGTVLPQWRRLTHLIMLYMTSGLRFKQLVFGARRPFDERVDQLSKLWTPDGKTPAGCLPFKPDADIPDSIPDSAKGNIDHFWMELLWNNIIKPDGLMGVEPVYYENPEQHIRGQRLDIAVASIVPHLFHEEMYRRQAGADSRVIMVSPWCLDGRHDLPYLADGLARYIDQYHQSVLASLKLS